MTYEGPDRDITWSDVEYEHNMVFSTGHITEEDNQKLTEAADPLSTQNALVVHSNEYFYLVYVPDVNISVIRRAGYSEQFIRILLLARMDKMDFVKLDRDGPVYSWLEEYDW